MSKLKLTHELLTELDEAISTLNDNERMYLLQEVIKRCEAIIATNAKDSTIRKIARIIETMAICEKDRD